MNKKVLIVDDDRSERRLIASSLRGSIGLDFIEAENGRDALRMLENDSDEDIRLVILDLEMPVMGGLEALKIIGERRAGLPVIILTGSTGTEDAVTAMKTGAVDFLSKPVENARLDVSAKNALKMALMSKEIHRLKRRAEDALGFSDLIGHGEGLSESVRTGRKAAACALPVLITGETGTGKEMFAQAIHGESNRVGKPFIAVNCGAIPEKLVESTLFGHEKGAFTGAVAKASGKFQEASGGTIFLDEIGELPLDAQVKLLRVLQQQEVEPVGASKPVPIDVRIISATNRDLAGEVKEKRFREDLFFRLNVLHIDLPPLRKRPGDIEALARFFIEHYCASHGGLPKIVTEESMRKLRSHSWPGNVRELENVINRAMALQDGERLEPGHFSFLHLVQKVEQEERRRIQEGFIVPLRENGDFKTFRELEQEIIMLALGHYGNNISRTARVLGMAKSTLYTKIAAMADLKSA